MCGIAGFYGKFDPALLERMSDAIAHRGPDDAGIYSNPEKGVGLAHRRLAIIDLSPLGHQPMWDSTGRAAIVFNGEIFNYRELRSKLISDGFRFTSHSDTEVLLNLYLRDGDKMLEALNGMFAFAIWDTRSSKLFLARDGIGVKPLYYSCCALGFLFASELKSILQEPAVERSLDPQAIRDHLTLLWSPAPRTMLTSVQKLEPGNALLIRNGAIERQWQFYDLPYTQPIEEYSEREAVEIVRTHIEQAVKRQMVADVPVGAFLSGGLDSSAIVAAARNYTGANRLQCFTIGFSGSWPDEGMTADLPYARQVAAHLGVDLHTVVVGPEMTDELETMIYHLDEPQADPAPLNALFICRLARQQGIKVLLSGAGGDDIFTGYRRHRALQLEHWWSWLPRPTRTALRQLTGMIPVKTTAGRRIAKAFRYADADGDDRIASYFSWLDPLQTDRLFSADLRASLRKAALPDPLLTTLARLPDDVPSLNRMLYLEGKHFLADHNLNYTDKMSMATGVEVRVPLLDRDLVALAARLPLRFKQRGHVGKWVLKEAMASVLPPNVIHRPKTGFGAPLRHWLRHELRPMTEEILSEPVLISRGLFDPAEVRRLLQADRDGRVDAAYTIFSLICIELWCRLFIDRRPAQVGR